jgi:hypothetical protein
MHWKHADETTIFWGLEYYNKELLQTIHDDLPGSVTTDLLIEKDLKSFTLRNGWAFPRRIYFNGHNCKMPMPDDFPGLPNGDSNPSKSCHFLFLLPVLVILFLQKLNVFV